MIIYNRTIIMMSTKKNIITSLLFCFIAFSAYSQNNDNQILEEAKKESEKVSEHLDINDDQEVSLYRAIYTFKKDKAKINSVDNLSESEKEKYLEKLEISFKNNVKHALNEDEQLKKKFFEYYETE